MRRAMPAPSSPLRTTLLAFAGLALAAGLLLVLGAEETDRWFSWTIDPPLSAAALGAFYWAAFALLLSAARSPSWAGMRPVVYPVLAIATVLLAVTLIHLERFDLDSVFGLFWLGAYILAPPLLVYGIVNRREGEAGQTTAGRPLPRALRAAVAVEGGAVLLVASVMLVAPDAAADFWPWTLTPLTSRALGAFALGVGLVAMLVARENELIVFEGMAAAYTALGVLQLFALGVHSEDLGGDELATTVYAVMLAAIAMTGLYGLIAASASARS